MLVRTSCGRLLAAFLLAIVPLHVAVADTLDDIKARGTLIVGGKADYKPFGYRQSDGKVVGFSVDLAEELAKELGVKLELVPTTAANQLQFLQQGKVDIIIAAMNDTPERRKVVRVVDPGYTASGATILSAKAAKISKWADIKGKKVCAVQGAYFNRPVQEKYEPTLVAYKTTSEAYTALKGGNCIGLVYDDNSILQTVQSPDWRDFEAPLSSILEQPTVMAVRLGEERLDTTVRDSLARWYKSGHIAELEKKWFGRNSAYVLEKTGEYKGK